MTTIRGGVAKWSRFKKRKRVHLASMGKKLIREGKGYARVGRVTTEKTRPAGEFGEGVGKKDSKGGLSNDFVGGVIINVRG